MRSILALLLALAASVNSQAQHENSDILRHREQYKQEFLTDPRAPLTAADTAFLAFFSPDTSWRISARFEATPDSPAFEMATYSGATRLYRQYGILYFTKNGRAFTLRIYQNLKLMDRAAYKDYLFLPFNDLTNGESTYGGGRYLDFRTGDIRADNTLLIDFNLCYNPWCAYSEGYSCPIPPRKNRLDLAVTAGERLFTGTKKH